MRINVTEQGCHEWTGRRNANGYPVVRMLGQDVLAHRLSFALNVGDLSDTDCVLHRCDNPPCINPEHLFKGTIADNVADMMAKGRHRTGYGSAIEPGEMHSTAKLTEDQARAIKASPERGTILAARYGISVATVSKIRTGKLWRHLNPEK